MRLPTPPDLTKLRGKLEGLQEQMRAERHAYAKKLCDMLPKVPLTTTDRAEFFLRAAIKMKEAGLYASSTVTGDIAFNLVKRMYQMTALHVDWRRSFEDWKNWKERESIDCELLHSKKKRRRAGMAI